MHSFAPFWNPKSKSRRKKNLAKTTPRKGKNEKRISSSSLASTSAKGRYVEKTKRMKIEYAYDIWSPFFWLQIQLRCPLGSVSLISLFSLKIAKFLADFDISRYVDISIFQITSNVNLEQILLCNPGTTPGASETAGRTGRTSAFSGRGAGRRRPAEATSERGCGR